MQSKLQTIRRVNAGTIANDHQNSPDGSFYKGKDPLENGPIKRIRGKVNAREACQIIFEIATIPAKEKLLTAPILPAIFGTFPGGFTVTPPYKRAIFYHSLRNDQISPGNQNEFRGYYNCPR